MAAATAGDADRSEPVRARFMPLGGEFAERPLEIAFRDHCAADTLRHARLLLSLAVAINTLFLPSDWRFVGTPHFAPAISARLAVIAASLICLAALMRWHSRRAVDATLSVWCMLAALGVAILVSSHSELALVVLVLLPAIYWVAVPLPFKALMVAAPGCSVALLVGYWWSTAPGDMGLGITLALGMLNAAFGAAYGRSGRIARRGWLAGRAERDARMRLQTSRETLERVFDASPVALYVISRATGKLLNCNERARAVVERGGYDLAKHGIRSIFVAPVAFDRVMTLLDRHRSISDYEFTVRRPNGQQRTLLASASLLDSPEGELILAGTIDITDRKASELSLERLATTDMLTGLPNRLGFFGAAERVLKLLSSRGAAALVMIDLDHFKRINDVHGHQAGDAALRAFSTLLRGALRPGDLAGRLGGEEFGLLLPDTDLGGARIIADRLRANLAALPLPDPWRAVRLTASFGVVPVLDGEDDLDAALSRADVALYAAKRGGRDRVELRPGRPRAATG